MFNPVITDSVLIQNQKQTIKLEEITELLKVSIDNQNKIIELLTKEQEDK